jgi:hypothetical protein
VAKPDNAQDGSLDLMVWKCIIPGKPGVCNFFYLSLWLFFFNYYYRFTRFYF